MVKFVSLSREMSKNIKKMNREEMESYLNNLCSQAYNNGVSAMSKELAERVDKGIRNTPGIGEKRYAELISNINAELNREDKEAGEKSE